MIFKFLSPPKVGGEYRGGFFFLASAPRTFTHELKHVAIEFDKDRGIQFDLTAPI